VIKSTYPYIHYPFTKSDELIETKEASMKNELEKLKGKLEDAK
jgi:hypothetical protein